MDKSKDVLRQFLVLISRELLILNLITSICGVAYGVKLECVSLWVMHF